jgi:hypothetical protein
LRVATRDLSSGSGLTANRINQSTPRDSILPLTWVPVLLDQHFAIDPCLPSFGFCNLKVTSLESRTPHQPEKLQNVSKNEVVFTPSVFRVKQKDAILSP